MTSNAVNLTYTILKWISYISIAYCLISLGYLARNYRIARKIGLPVLVGVASPINLLWLAFNPILRPIIRKYGTDGLKITCLAWMHDWRSYFHEKYGIAFISCTPNGNEIWVADPLGIKTIMNGYGKGIKKPIHFYKFFDVFGPTVISTEGAVWHRHRKITTPPFNEKVSELVWRETLLQTDKKFQDFLKSESVTTTADTVASLSLGILASTALGIHDVEGSEPTVPGCTFSYKKSLEIVLENMLTALVLPSQLQSKTIQTAVIDFERYLTYYTNREKERYAKEGGSVQSTSLLSALVRESELAKLDNNEDSVQPFSDREIIGNLFMYNVAGHDTTAVTLTFTIYVLALYPQYQSWMREEILKYTVDDDYHNWDYKSVFPKLIRCLAVMYEALRIYPPADTAPRYASRDMVMEFSHNEPHIPKVINIPAGTMVNPAMAIVQYHPKFWGEEPLAYRPNQWIQTRLNEDGTSKEIFESPAIKDTFWPWAGGPRVCPGKKFSQVEFVAALAILFRNHEVRLAKVDGESEEQTRKRAEEMIQDVIVVPTKKLRHPEKVALTWVSI